MLFIQCALLEAKCGHGLRDKMTERSSASITAHFKFIASLILFIKKKLKNANL